MNASTAFITETIVATPAAERFGKGLLLVNGTLLALTGAAQGMFDLAGYFLNLGPTAAALYQNPDAIGFLEAHGLALIIGLLMVLNRNAQGAAWHWIGASVHLLLGAANLLFWPVFEVNGLVPMGVAATAAHVLFFALQTTSAFARTPSVFGAAGAWFRGLTLVTLATGAVLHGASLPLGREAFVQQLFTPAFDAVFAVPMTAAAALGWLLLPRAIFRAAWERAVYLVMLVYFSLSVVIHARTLFTWDTSYVLAFPVWYSLPLFAVFGLLAAFTIRQQFRPAVWSVT